MSSEAYRVESLVSRMISGDRSSIAQIISKVENRDKDLAAIMNLLYPRTGRALIVGVAGPRGAGKSTLVDRMTTVYRGQGKTVAIVNAGSLLSPSRVGDVGVYTHRLREPATTEPILVLDSAGFDLVFVETAGTELDILRLAQTVIVVIRPENGDSTPFTEERFMDVADIFVMNQPDRDQQRTPVSYADSDGKTEATPLLKTCLIREDGINELLALMDAHQVFLRSSGKLRSKRIEFLKSEVSKILSERLSLSLQHQFETSSGCELLEKLSRLEINPYQAADLFSGV